MKVGDLVRWRHASETDVGIVVTTRANHRTRPSHYTTKSSYIHWSDGDRGWFENVDLEVINESR